MVDPRRPTRPAQPFPVSDRALVARSPAVVSPSAVALRVPWARRSPLWARVRIGPLVAPRSGATPRALRSAVRRAPCPRARPAASGPQHVHPETRLLEKRRQMFGSGSPGGAKAAFARRQAFDRREETLRRKDRPPGVPSPVRKSSRRTTARRRGPRKAGDERKLRLQKEAELDRLSDDPRRSASPSAERQFVQRKNRYAEYLDAVVDAFGATNGYGEDLIIGTDSVTNADLMRQDQQLAAAIDARGSLLETAKEKRDQT